MKDRIRLSELSKKRKDEIRAEIVEFCLIPRAYQEVATKFNLGGISASAILTSLLRRSKLEYISYGMYVKAKEE